MYTALATILCFPSIGRDSGLDFVSNGRQWPGRVHYRAALPGGAVFLTKLGFTYSYYSVQDLEHIHALKHDKPAEAERAPVNCHAYNVRFLGCDSTAAIVPKGMLPNYYNFFLGADSAHWAGGLPAFEAIRYKGLYKGIDLDVYSKGGSLKYDFVIAPNADASQIKLHFEGVTPHLDPEGDLVLETSVARIKEKAPYAYQRINGVERRVACHYVLKNNQVSFSFPDGYDRSKPLIIDPVLVFATYSGSTAATFGWSATYDTSGNLYAGGECFATGWPVTTGAFQTTFGTNIDAAINKYSSNGSTLIYSTYYGGNGGDYPNTMVVNRFGELIVAGATRSPNLPVTGGCYDNSYNGQTDVYVARFNAAGSALIGATYLGGSANEGDVSTTGGHEANRGEVLTDTFGNIYIAFATVSSDFPVSAGAFQAALNGNMDAFVAKLNGSCSNLLFSTYLGGSGYDAAVALQLTASGKLIVGGGTTSTDFPGTGTGWQSSNQGGTDGFIAILNDAGSSVLRATYVGTSGSDNVAKLQIDAAGFLYATGIDSTGAFPVSPGVYSVANGRNYICKFDTLLTSRLLSTTVGATASPIRPSAFLVDVCSNIYLIGYDAPSGLATTSNAFQAARGGFWMAVLNPNMASLIYATYFGAQGDHIDGGSSRLDAAGIVYHSICTNSTTVPATSTVWSPTKKTAGYDMASWKFNFQLMGMKAGFDIGPKDTFCAPAVISFNNTSYGALNYLWNFGDGSATSAAVTPTPHTYIKAGTYRIRLYTYNVAACKTIDSAVRTIYVYERDTVKLLPPPLILCRGDIARIPVKPEWKLTVAPAASANYQASGGTEIVLNPDTTTSYVITAANINPCTSPGSDTIRFTIIRDTSVVRHVNPITDTLLCIGDTAEYYTGVALDSLLIIPAVHYAIRPDSQTIRFFPPATTSYQLISLKTNKCQAIRDTLRFTIHRSTLNAAFELSPRITDQQQPEFRLSNRSKGAKSYNWYLNNTFWTAQTNPSLTGKDTGTYCFTLIADDLLGCADTAYDCGRLIETHIYLPSAFSPNGDLKNDVFRPILNNVEIMEFSVFNRYGQRVFVSYDNRWGWDGTQHGGPCDVGVYFYSIRYRILDRAPQLLKGDVTLIR